MHIHSSIHSYAVRPLSPHGSRRAANEPPGQQAKGRAGRVAHGPRHQRRLHQRRPALGRSHGCCGGQRRGRAASGSRHAAMAVRAVRAVRSWRAGDSSAGGPGCNCSQAAWSGLARGACCRDSGRRCRPCCHLRRLLHAYAGRSQVDTGAKAQGPARTHPRLWRTRRCWRWIPAAAPPAAAAAAGSPPAT
jgi:hypothetical protein